MIDQKNKTIILDNAKTKCGTLIELMSNQNESLVRYRIHGNTEWRSCHAYSVDVAKKWISGRIVNRGWLVDPPAGTEKSELLLDQIFNSIDADDRNKLIDSLEEFQEHLKQAGLLPNLTSETVIDSFISNSNWLSIEARGCELMEEI